MKLEERTSPNHALKPNNGGEETQERTNNYDSSNFPKEDLASRGTELVSNYQLVEQLQGRKQVLGESRHDGTGNIQVLEGFSSEFSRTKGTK